MSTETIKPIRICKLSIEAFKRISAIELTFGDNDDLIEITGKNGAGKSSVLDAIAAALGGKTLCPDKPIKRGHKRGSVTVDLGDMNVERVFTESGSTVTITAKDGSKFPSPQAMLDKLFANLSFDPFKFMRLEPRQQVAELKAVSGLATVLEPLEASIKVAAEARANTNRELHAAKAAAATAESTPIPVGPDVEQSATMLLDEIQRLQAQKAENDTRRRKRADFADKANRLSSEIEAIEAKIAELKLEMGMKHAAWEAAAYEVEQCDNRDANLVDPDIESVREQLRYLEANNATARKVAQAKAQRETTAKTLKAALEQHKTTCQRVDSLVAERENILAAAKFPVPGLGFDETGPTLNGLPLAQASSAQQLRASCLIVLAQKAEARIMTVHEGALLDSDSREILRQIAEEHDAQIFLEIATDGEQMGIVIEDGMVKGV